MNNHNTTLTISTAFNVGNIPDELKAYDSWVLWRPEQRDRQAKPTKVPYNPNAPERRAKANDPTTWGSYEQALAVATRSDGAFGIGFQCPPDVEIVGFDLDKCRNPETGEITAWALDALRLVNSYSEVSPSGTGIRIISYGKKPGNRAEQGGQPDYMGGNTGEFSLFDNRRFLTITGRHIEGTPLTVEHRQEAISELYSQYFDADSSPKQTPQAAPTTLTDREIIERAMNAADGAKFKALWEGDWQAYDYQSQSEADAGLCSMIGFWVNRDKSRIYSIFRQSPYFAKKDSEHLDKWERDDYRLQTLELVSKGKTWQGQAYAEYTPGEPYLNGHSTYSDEALAGLKTVVDGLVERVKSGDVGAPFEPDMLTALKNFKSVDLAEWMRIRQTFKDNKVSLSSLETTLKGDAEDDNPSGMVVKLAESIAENEHFALDVGGRLHRYIKGVYKPKAEAYVRNRVKFLVKEWGLETEWTSHRAEEVIKWIVADAPEIPDMPPAHILNLENGLLDISKPSNPVLKPHTPEFLSVIQLPMEYRPECTCQEIQWFISEVAEADCFDLAFEVIGVLLVAGLGKRWAILLIGQGGTGKSTFLDLIRRVIGPTLTSNMPLHKLEDNRFATARLLGKLINVYADLPDKHLETTSIFRMITGDDAIDAEIKHKDGFDFVPVARLLFSANAYPRSADASSAFFERWLPIPFNHKFRDSNEERFRDELLEAMTTPEEKSGLLNLALEGLARFTARGNRYEFPNSVKKSLDEFWSTTDPLVVWLESNIVVDPNAYIPRETLLQAYNNYAKANGISGYSATSFSLAIRKVKKEWFSDETTAQKTVQGKTKWAWTGVGLKNISQKAQL